MKRKNLNTTPIGREDLILQDSDDLEVKADSEVSEVLISEILI